MTDAVCAAARAGDMARLHELLEEGASVRNMRWSGVTPLHRACEGGHVAVIETLVSHGADVNAKATWGWYTPLHLAARYGHEAAIMALLHAGANWSQIDKYRATPHKYAVRAGHASMAHRIDDVCVAISYLNYDLI
ncbi:hypothetical protein ACHHYP_20074 [Achlya hypogyna]|uniref:Uncharacterized protein n=1 Tax=Achlya hypogyna TaxID=1202772 RepID=A0A1V9ZSZ9_ACHHY|nr:hypothetical protein ACHHYP_20074 [Achlya hypogyna]